MSRFISVSCGICGVLADHRAYDIKEMQFGSREIFRYYECSSCGCLQLANLSRDFHRYYPADYKPFRAPEPGPSGAARSPVIQRLRESRNHHAVFESGFIGGLLNRVFPLDPKEAPWWCEPFSCFPDRGLRFVRLDRHSRILDVGSGNGDFLRLLSAVGFRHLLGIDLFIPSEVIYPGLPPVLKKGITEVSGQWDLVMFHHSFEHMPDPLGVLKTVLRLLSPHGTCLLRIPTVSSYAWKHYGTNWVQCDAPRHLFLHSTASIRLLARQAGFCVSRIVYDSTDFQFWASVQYGLDIPLWSERSWAVDPQRCPFDEATLQSFRQQAENLNQAEDGDQAIFILEKDDVMSGGSRGHV
jgi:SAM-dependent methyltransferase